MRGMPPRELHVGEEPGGVHSVRQRIFHGREYLVDVPTVRAASTARAWGRRMRVPAAKIARKARIWTRTAQKVTCCAQAVRREHGVTCPERPRKVNARIAEREDSRCRAGQSHETRVRRAGPEASPRLPAQALPMRVSPALWGLRNPRKAARSVCLVCQASLVTSRVSSLVTSARLAR